MVLIYARPTLHIAMRTRCSSLHFISCTELESQIVTEASIWRLLRKILSTQIDDGNKHLRVIFEFITRIKQVTTSILLYSNCSINKRLLKLILISLSFNLYQLIIYHKIFKKSMLNLLANFVCKHFFKLEITGQTHMCQHKA